jgi:hypothetical protein
MRLTFSENIGSLRFRRYHHERYGIVETLTKDTVTYVRPVFGLRKPDDQQQPEVAEATRRSRQPRAHTPDRPPKQRGSTCRKPRHETRHCTCGRIQA